MKMTCVPVRLVVLTTALALLPMMPGLKAQAPAAKPAAAPAAILTDAIKAAFKAAYPNATIKNASKEKEDGQVIYEVESIDAGLARAINYKADGTVISYEEQIPQSAVPAAVMTAVKTRYPKATITLSEKLFTGGVMNYELTLKGAAVSEVELTPEGKWISPKPAK